MDSLQYRQAVIDLVWDLAYRTEETAGDEVVEFVEAKAVWITFRSLLAGIGMRLDLRPVDCGVSVCVAWAHVTAEGGLELCTQGEPDSGGRPVVCRVMAAHQAGSHDGHHLKLSPSRGRDHAEDDRFPG